MHAALGAWQASNLTHEIAVFRVRGLSPESMCRTTIAVPTMKMAQIWKYF
jgi:hypothetical protein